MMEVENVGPNVTPNPSHIPLGMYLTTKKWFNVAKILVFLIMRTIYQNYSKSLTSSSVIYNGVMNRGNYCGPPRT